MEHSSRIIELQGALNARELGGLPLKNGKNVKYRKLIRSGKLSALTAHDCLRLKEIWNVTRIIDLRNDQEITESPDVKIEGTTYEQISIISGPIKGITREVQNLPRVDRMLMTAKALASGGGAEETLRRTYAQMVEDPNCIQRLRDFFSMALEHQDGAFIWHCTAGKDRTGITGMLLLYALGAEMDVIREDYLYTNVQTREACRKLVDMVKDRGADENLIHQIRAYQSVDWSYMESFLNAVDKLYGGMDSFLTFQMGLTEEKMQLLLEKYAE